MINKQTHITDNNTKNELLDNFSCILDNIIFQQAETEKKAGSIILTQDLTRETHWYDVVESGPLSIVKPNDKILMSTRMTCYKFEVEGVKLSNTEDKSVIAVKRQDESGETILATAGTIIYEWIDEDPVETTTESGLVLIFKDTTKERIVSKARVIAAGPLTGVEKDDIILIPYNKDAYKLDKIIPGKILHNVGYESIICYWKHN